jgi:large subunit ribosomal protein L10e
MKGRNYRSPSGQPYTRQKYIHGTPNPKVSKFNMGDNATHFPIKVHLVSMEPVQIRHNALESGRVAANKVLFDKYGETGYRLQLVVYPHIILRENKMIATAGADRLQEGMRRAFGKPTGRAARIREGQSIIIVHVPEDGVEVGKKACETAGTKMPTRTRVVVEHVPVEQVATPATPTEEPAMAAPAEPAETPDQATPVGSTVA